MSLYKEYQQLEEWDKNLPPSLVPPLKHLRDAFEEAHWTYGQITEKICYHRLHPDEPDDISEYLRPLEQLKGWAGAKASQSFLALLHAGTAPAIFKAFFDLYMESITRSALAVLVQLTGIGKANENLLGAPHLDWAEAQAKNMIRSEMHLIEIWVRNVCDKQPYDPNEDAEELIFWRKWQAPKLIVMKPSRYRPYEPSAIWERFDAVESRRLLEAFAENYVIHAETRVGEVTGQSAVELAKQPAPPTQPAVSASLEQPPNGEARAVRTGSTPREARRKSTLNKYARWHKEYLQLKKTHPDKSDVWLSQKIAKTEKGLGSSPETIRRHMKQK